MDHLLPQFRKLLEVGALIHILHLSFIESPGQLLSELNILVIKRRRTHFLQTVPHYISQHFVKEYVVTSGEKVNLKGGFGHEGRSLGHVDEPFVDMFYLVPPGGPHKIPYLGKRRYYVGLVSA